MEVMPVSRQLGRAAESSAPDYARNLCGIADGVPRGLSLSAAHKGWQDSGLCDSCKLFQTGLQMCRPRRCAHRPPAGRNEDAIGDFMDNLSIMNA